MIVVKLLPIQNQDSNRPDRCPHCGSQVLQRWGTVERELVNTEPQTTSGFRYYCTECQRTFRSFPDGVSRSLMAFRIQYLAAWLVELGLTTREIEDIFEFLESPISRSTISRIRSGYAGQTLEKRLASSGRYYIDREFINGISQKFGVVLGLDAGSGRVFVIGTLNESHPIKALSWLDEIMQGVNVSVQLKSTSLFLNSN